MLHKEIHVERKNYDVPVVNAHAFLRIVKRVVTWDEIYESAISRLIGTMEAYYRTKNDCPTDLTKRFFFSLENVYHVSDKRQN